MKNFICNFDIYFINIYLFVIRLFHYLLIFKKLFLHLESWRSFGLGADGCIWELAAAVFLRTDVPWLWGRPFAKFGSFSSSVLLPDADACLIICIWWCHLLHLDLLVFSPLWQLVAHLVIPFGLFSAFPAHLVTWSSATPSHLASSSSSCSIRPL